MTINRKVNAIVEKGGKVAVDQHARPKMRKILLSVPVRMLDKIDELVEIDEAILHRTRWILKAIQEKLDRDMRR